MEGTGRHSSGNAGARGSRGDRSRGCDCRWGWGNRALLCRVWVRGLALKPRSPETSVVRPLPDRRGLYGAQQPRGALRLSGGVGGKGTVRSLLQEGSELQRRSQRRIQVWDSEAEGRQFPEKFSSEAGLALEGTRPRASWGRQPAAPSDAEHAPATPARRHTPRRGPELADGVMGKYAGVRSDSGAPTRHTLFNTNEKGAFSHGKTWCKLSAH